jgi:hypothetical protein
MNRDFKPDAYDNLFVMVTRESFAERGLFWVLFEEWRMMEIARKSNRNGGDQ